MRKLLKQPTPALLTLLLGRHCNLVTLQVQHSPDTLKYAGLMPVNLRVQSGPSSAHVFAGCVLLWCICICSLID